MLFKKNMISHWIENLVNEYRDYTKKSLYHRCKIVGIERDEKKKRNKFLIQVNGIRNQVFSYYPEDLVTNDAMLREFSQTDVRAITFYSISSQLEVKDSTTRYKIISQEYMDDKSLFVFKEINLEGEYRMFARDLYANDNLLRQFDFSEVSIIIHAAVQEQMITDLG